MVETLEKVLAASEMKQKLEELWPELKKCMEDAADLRENRALYPVVCHHDRALHPAVHWNALDKESVPVEGKVIAALKNQEGSVCLGRIQACFQTKNSLCIEPCPVGFPFCDIVMKLAEDVDKIVYENVAAGLPVGPSPSVVKIDISNTKVAVDPLHVLLHDMTRMVFEETKWRPWGNFKFNFKLCKCITRAFLIALAMDHFIVPQHFSENVNAWKDFLDKQNRVHFCGLKREQDLEELRQACEKVSDGSIKDVLVEAMRACYNAPPCDRSETYEDFLRFLEVVLQILALFDLCTTGHLVYDENDCRWILHGV